jgi:signal transduction histidine kinase
MLQTYISEGGEVALIRAYNFARQALQDGCGILEIADIHHQALHRLMAEQPAANMSVVLTKASDFFAECLSPFEMSHRGAREGARALRHLNEVLEAELKRIAHALHDEAGQLLASVHIALVDVADDLPAGARPRIDEIKKLLWQIEGELRNLSHELRPTMLDNLGLIAGLEFLAERVGKRTGLAVTVKGVGEPRLAPAIETALYRIVQEALNNTVKHAKAKSVRIELRRSASRITCSIQDDGIGFHVQRTPSSAGFGLIGVRERLNALGGSLRIVSAPERGTTLFADIPTGG